jgi:hypothetical protein
MCTAATPSLRLFTHAFVPARPSWTSAGLGDWEPCICELCHKANTAKFTYTPGCRCEQCRGVHHALLTIADAHLGPVRLFTCLASGGLTGQDAKLYKEIR